jgi:hypothetical protein
MVKRGILLINNTEEVEGKKEGRGRIIPEYC